ncbi:MAG: beta-ketoacyl synthase N-terminal-like domain-containing protein, partial [Myxococcota bacterium]
MSTDAPVAIVGVGCRLPGGAVDAASAWSMFRAGVDAIGPVPPDRWDPASVPPIFSARPLGAGFPAPDGGPARIVPAVGGFVDGIDRFDAGLFG